MNTTLLNCRKGFIIVLAVMTMLFAVDSALAQMAVTNTADATVLAAIQLAATDNLNFGDVFQGVPKIVPRTATGADTTAAIFTITGEAGAGITAHLVLPEYIASASGAQMTIAFEDDVMAIDTTTTATPATVAAGDGWVDQDPRSFPAGLVIGGTAGPTTTTKIYLGGKVIPSMFQEAGTYTGDILLSVSYIGN